MLAYEILCFLVGRFSILLLAFILHQVWPLLVHPKSFKPVLPYEFTIPTYMLYFCATLSKFVCVISNFQNKFLFYVLVPLARWWGVADIFHARCVILMMSVYSLVIPREYGKGIRYAQFRNEKWIYFMLSINKFVGKCWYGGHPWIRLAMESGSMVEKGINFIFCLGTSYDVSSMESVGNSKSFSLVGKICLPKSFYLSIFLWALAPLQIPSSLGKGPFFYFVNFFFFYLSLHLLL